ncbi:MAG: hypothetical protein J5714_02865 [Alphaproteobacteria bacterium]|nr:hypothetical protein [Alphaproteobacteria bacterium]
MRKNILIVAVFGACMMNGVMAAYTIGEFTAPRGANGANGTNGTNGTNGADACPPLISSDTKDANGCFVVKQRAQVRNNGSCQATGSWTTIDTVCDCRPTETRTRCYGTGDNKCDDTTRTGVKIVTTQCDGTGSTTSYIYDNDCGITIASVADVHRDNDSNEPVTHKRVTFKDCNNNTLSTTADIPVGTDGAACEAEVVTTACGPVGTASVRCADTAKRGIKVERKNCSGQIVDADTQYIYNGDNGTSFNFMGTVASCGALQVKPGVRNDAWLVGTKGDGDGEGKLCIYGENGWPTNCPDDCAEFTGPAGANNCTALEDSSTAVKNSTLAYSAPTKTNQSDAYYTGRGGMLRTNVMCNPNLNNTIEKLEDTCFQIVKPTNSACTGVYMECTPKGTYEGNTNYSKYNLCVTTTGTTIESALSNKEDNPCAGNNSSSTTIERTQTTAYSVPTGNTTTVSSYTYYTNAPGKVVTTSVKCDTSGNTVIGTTQDKCVEITKPTGVCTSNDKKFYQCKPQGKIGSDTNLTPYYLCASELEPSLLDKINTAQNTAAEAASAAETANPCVGSNSNSATIIKSTTSTSYNRGTKSDGLYPSIGGKTVTKTACDGTTTYVTTEQDSCVEIAKPSGVCTPASSAYLRCYNAQVNSDNTYYVCQDLGDGNKALNNKIDGKADATAVTASALANTLGSTYLKPTDSISASNLTGTIDAGRLPNTVVTTGDDATHGFNTLIGNAVQTEVATQIESAKLVSESDLADYVKTDGTNLPNSVVTTTSLGTQTFNFGKDSNDNDISLSISEIVSLLHAAAGTCTRNAESGTTTCQGGSLGTITTSTRQ